MLVDHGSADAVGKMKQFRDVLHSRRA